MPPQPLLASLSTPELKTITCNVAVPVPPEWIEERYGSYHKLLCINAWCFRSLSNLKCKLQNQPLHLNPYLNTSELQTSTHHLFSRAQARSFTHELSRIRENKSIKTSSTLSSLSPFLGDGGLLRVGGRLSNSNLSHSQKHPPIMSGKDHPNSLVLVTMHVALGHCGPSLLLSATGNRMHVVGARRLARTTCKSCITCRKVTARTEAQMMGQLPHQRVHPSPAFTITGVDNSPYRSPNDGPTTSSTCSPQPSIYHHRSRLCWAIHTQEGTHPQACACQGIYCNPCLLQQQSHSHRNRI